MKKKIIYIVMLITLLFTFVSSIKALELESNDVKPGTYIIGKYAFTRDQSEVYDGKLTIKYIMLAAKTIEGDTLDDMVIYYKKGDGSYVDPSTLETVIAPETFEIEQKNMEIFLAQPELASPIGAIANGSIRAMLSGVYEGVYSDPDIIYNLDGEFFEIEFYEKEGNEYTLIEKDGVNDDEYSIHVSVKGEKKVFVAKACIIANDRKVCSDYSNELELDAEFDGVPTLTESGAAGGPYGGFITYEIENYGEGIALYRATEEDGEYELVYEKSIDEFYNEQDHKYYLTIDYELGDHYYYRVKTYVENTNEANEYSDYSDTIVEIDERLETPTLSNPIGSGLNGTIYAHLTVVAEGAYATEEMIELISDVEYYEKKGSKYTKLESNNIKVINEKKTFVAKVCYEREDKTVCSDYSNELELDAEFDGVPTLTESGAAGGPYGGFITYEIENYGEGIALYRATEEDGEYELVYEKSIDEFYNEQDHKYYLTIDYELGDHYYYRVKTYVENTNEANEYSDYSNKVVINNTGYQN